MRKSVLLILLILSTLIVAGCGSSEEQSPELAGAFQGEPVQTAQGTYFNVDVNQVKPLLEDESVLTVNVHVPYAGEIPGTDASIPFNEIGQRVDALPADKDAPIVLYCRGGGMSTQASETLVGLGYTQVLNLTGGMTAWQRAGNELVQSNQSSSIQPDQSSNAQGPRLVFAQPTADYGEVPIDQMVTHRFEFTNQGDAPLIIDGEPAVETLAGC